MKKLLSIVFSSLLLLSFILCSCEPEDLGTSSIYGIVTDKSNGEPIISAAVELYPIATKLETGSDGRFEFNNLKAGNYQLYITQKNYTEVKSANIELRIGQTLQRDVQMELLPPALRVVNDSRTDISELDFGSAETDVARSFNLFNDGADSLEWEITFTANWVKSVSKTEGVLESGKPQPLIVTIDRNLLSSGNNITTMHITSNRGSKQLKIIAIGKTLSQVDTNEVTDVKSKSALFNGIIIEKGMPIYNQRGFVYSLKSNPTIDNTIELLTYPVTDDDKYSLQVNNLVPNTSYYVKSYVRNGDKVSYGREVVFTTPGLSTELRTESLIEVEPPLAYLKGTILNEGVPGYSECGFCYSTSHNPTINDIRRRINKEGVGEFDATIDNIEVGKVYYLRTYAVQLGNILYGNEVSFQAKYKETLIETVGVSNIGARSAKLSGKIEEVGSPKYSEKGFCYSTTQSPTINDSKIVYKGTGEEFSVNVDNLLFDKKYYFRAYAIQEGNVVYGDIMSFNTQWIDAEVITLEASEVGLNSATLRAYVQKLGVPEFTEYGFCYSSSSDPTINDTKIISNNISSLYYTYNLEDLDYQTTYYARAYLKQENKVIYGETISFNTIDIDPAIVVNNGIKNKGEGRLTFSAKITNIGFPAFSEYGFVVNYWDVDYVLEHGSDDLIPSKFVPTTNSCVGGEFIHTFTFTEPMSVVGYRPYLIQANDTILGEVYYEIVPSKPIVSTKQPQQVTSSSLGMVGYLEWQGHPELTEQGFVVSVYESDPKIGYPDCQYAAINELKKGMFGMKIDLPANTYIYYRAYAKNSYGITYGNVVRANTLSE